MTDFDGIAAATALVDGLGIFSEVLSGFEPTGYDPIATKTPWAWVRPTSWKTADAWGGGNAEERLRTISFEVEIQTRAGEKPEPQDLAAAVETAIHGQPLADSLPHLTLCETGQYARYGRGAGKVQHVLMITGSFSYITGTT